MAVFFAGCSSRQQTDSRASLATWNKTRSVVEAVAAFGEPEERLPQQAVDGDDHGGHDDGGEQQQALAAGIGGVIDLGAEAEGGIGVLPEAEVLGDDAGIPCAPGSGDQ